MRRSKIAKMILLVFVATLARPADAPATVRPEDILRFLNQSIVWYRLLATQQQLVNEPSDAVFLSDNRQIADEVVRFSFQFARTEAQQIVSQAPAGAASSQDQANPAQSRNLLNRAQQSKQEISNQEQKIESLKQQLGKASGKKRTVLESAVAESEAELELLKTRDETVQNILQFASGMSASTGPKNLETQIDELARTVPAATPSSKPTEESPSAPATTSTPVTAPGERSAEATGLFGLIAQVFEYRHKVALLDTSLQLTDSLADASRALRTPLVDQIKSFSQRGDELANQQQSQDPAVLQQQQAELKGLTAQYKQLSATILPLGKQSLLFDLYKRNVNNWRTAVATRYSELLKRLLVRVGTVVGLVALILIGSLVWRRVTFRYVQDSRRRHQFLILRRIIVTPLLLVVVVFAFANGLGSVTLFAGLSTAGLAVALQNLIQAVVGYFVLIGKYGVRVGDRIQVSGVTGEVIDIGMIRLHLVEMSTGPGSRPTGRVVAFSNAVVFQPNAGFFKQIPGTNFVWHEVSLIVGSETDYRQLEERMMQAVKRIFSHYQDKMEAQRRSVETAIQGFSSEPFHPESRLYLTPTGTQVTVRYPVEMNDAAEMDDRIAREVLDATGREPRVEPAILEAPEHSGEEVTEIRKSE